MNETTDDFDLEPPHKATLPGSSTHLEFSTYASLFKWLTREIEIWAPLVEDSRTSDSLLASARDGLQRSINALENLKKIHKGREEKGDSYALDESVRQSISSLADYFRKLENGELICWDSECAARVKELSANDRNAALFYAGLHMSRVREELASFGRSGYARVADALLRTIGVSDASGARAQLGQSIAELKAFRLEVDSELAKFTQESSSLHTAEAEAIALAKAQVAERTEEWAKTLEQVNADISSLRTGFRTEFALRAPTAYWQDKHKRHARLAITFAILFLATASTGIAIFLGYGAPLLTQAIASSSPQQAASASSTAQTAPVIWASLAAVLLPGFLFVWVLRVLGRLFSTHTNLVEDSAERVTMAKTFLALAGSESGGKLVSDADRTILLNALFRASSVTASDDAPPVNVVELILNKMKVDGSKP